MSDATDQSDTSVLLEKIETASHDLNGVDWFEYYSQARESCHQYCKKSLDLLFQYTSFSIATITVCAIVYEKVGKAIAFCISVSGLVAQLFLLFMTIRYFSIGRVTSKVCQDIEKEHLFGTVLAPKYGVLCAVVQHKSGFFSSNLMRLIIIGYSALLFLILATVAAAALWQIINFS